MRLSKPLTQLRSSYTAVVIGSGYGGGVAAARLARAGVSVCLLERGREFRPGDFPDTAIEALRQLRIGLPQDDGQSSLGAQHALFDMRVYEDINVVAGCGLGGTSLINAGVAECADPRVFDDPCWPQALRDDRTRGLAEAYARAAAMLQPGPYPAGAPALHKLDALRQSADSNGWPCARVPICVRFAAGPNGAGLEQPACDLCGDCISGCNRGAKGSTDTNYLADAARHGAELFTDARVSFVARRGDRWVVHFHVAGTGRESFAGPALFVTSDLVVLAAGTLGTTEILLRSREQGLELSPSLGKRFSGNGDAIGFAYNCDRPIHGIGHGASAEARLPVGPCITGIVDCREGPLEEGIIIEEGVLPGAMAPALPLVFAATSALIGRDTDADDAWEEGTRVTASLVGGARAGATANAMTLLVMGHDDAGGEMRLEDDRLVVHWPGCGEQPLFKRIDEALLSVARPLGGTYVMNPLWSPALGRRAVTVHPLGGCTMGDDAANGVVDHAGRVFCSTEGTAVHPGLLVCDGSVVPRSLGVNPLFTITALAERSMAFACRERGWTSDPSPPTPWSLSPEKKTVGIEFTESMRGNVQAADGEAQPFRLIFTIRAADLDGLVERGEPAAFAGTVECPLLDARPLMATQGRFSLMIPHPETVRMRRMIYTATLTAQDGRSFQFQGEKRLRDDPGFDAWADTTTLDVSVAGQAGAFTGTLRIEPEDFARQLGTLKAPGAGSDAEAVEAIARFGYFFAGRLAELYGGPFAPASLHDPRHPARPRRSLRAPQAEVHEVRARDGVMLRLTRHRGGDKGPVLLSPGLGVASTIFSLDTIDTNLVEYLCAAGYDVWLFDHRGSIAVLGPNDEPDGDQVAREDYPAVVAAVRARTGAAAVDVIAHCFGALTLSMALLTGLEGVRSVVFSQVAAHVRAPMLTRIKTALRLPTLVRWAGFNSLSAYTDAAARFGARIFNRLLAFQPMPAGERCNSSVCHRVTFLYGLLYQHARLNVKTHDTLHEWFGAASMTAMAHLAAMVRAGRLVDAKGGDVYLSQAEYLALPITFIHGEKNRCYLPESTARTYEWLRAHNGPELYRRHVIAGYGHIDCIFGKDAARDVYPLMLDHLENHARKAAPDTGEKRTSCSASCGGTVGAQSSGRMPDR